MRTFKHTILIYTMMRFLVSTDAQRVSTSAFLTQALLLAPPTAIEEHHLKNKTPQTESSFKKNNKRKSKGSYRKGTKASRQLSITTAQHIGGEFMEKMIKGLKSVDFMLDDLKNRLLLTQKGKDGNVDVNDEIDSMFDTALEQGVTFHTEDARKALIEKMESKLIEENKPKFVVGVMGTSVTAGHDNWFNESWSVVFGQWLSPVFEAVDIQVEVRNHAIGGNRYETSAYCVEATVGEDTDAFFFEFNMIFHGPAEAFEPFIRHALSLPNRPVFCQMLGFDAEDPEVPSRADETGALVPGKSEAIDIAQGLVLGKYRGRKNSGKYLDWKEWVPIESLTNLPKRITTPYKFSQPPNYWREGRSSLFDHYAKFGMHYSDPDGYMREINHLPSFWGVSLNGNKAAPCGSANWHPGPRAHNLRAMVLAFHYIEAFGDAIEAVICALSKQQGGLFKASGHAGVMSSLSAMRETLKSKRSLRLPPPLTAALQKLPNQNPSPKCALTMSPTMRSHSLLNHIVPDKTSEGRAVVDRRYGKSTEGLMGWRNWQVVAPPWTVNEVKCSHEAGYLDRKWALQGDDSSGWLTLEFEVETDNTPLALCEVACNWGKCPAGRGSLGQDIEVEIDENQGMWVVPALIERNSNGPAGSPLLAMLMKSKVCVEMIKAGGGSINLSKGKHELRLRVKKRDTYVLLSHMIWF